MKAFPSLLAAALLGGLVAALLVLALVGPPPAGAGVHYRPVTGPPRPLLFPTDPAPAAPPPGRRDLPTTAVDLRAAARLARPAVVHIAARSSGDGRDAVKQLFGRGGALPGGAPGGEGSGVFYNRAGYVITNHHVVRGTDRITVTTSDRRTLKATLVGSDPKSDLAVLRVPGEDFPFLKHADSDAAEAGQWVLAVGSPLGLVSTVTAGIISAKGRNLSILRDLDAIESFIQTDAAVNPGNSGGPLVDAGGRLLGINTAIASQTGRFQGYSFAIPVNLVRRVVDDIIEFGEYRRPLLGVDISSLTADDVARLGLGNRTQGVLVDRVLAGGAAERGGLRAEDVIIEVDGRRITDLPELTERIGRARSGDALRLRVAREGRLVELTVELGGD